MKLTILLTVAGLATAYGFACSENFCTELADCTNAPKSAADCTAPAVFRPNGSTCGCCGACITELDLGQPCPLLSSPFIQGGGAPTVVCKQPYVCLEGKCAEFKQKPLNLPS